MQAEVLAPRKAGGDERPHFGVSLAELGEPRIVGEALPDVANAIGQELASSPEPARGADQNHDENHQQRDGKTRLRRITLEARDVSAEDVAKEAEGPRPDRAAECVVQRERAVW